MVMENGAMRVGRCLCGACSYEIDGAPIIVAQCHCLDCQRLSGSGHTTGLMFPEAAVRIAGTPKIYELTSEAGNIVTRLFCGDCGSPLFGRNTGMPGFMTVTAGTLDSSDDLRPQVSVFRRSLRSWDSVDPGIPSFDAQPGWKPDT